jgi:predicted O-methyltransferase YrrM
MVDKIQTIHTMRNQLYTQGLSDLIDYVNKHNNTKEMTMVEIGSYAGESTQLFAKHFKHVISIDPYINDYDPNDVTCSYMELEKVYEIFKTILVEYSNIEHIRLTSDEAINKINNLKIDFIYIDGLHTYQQIKNDINNYKPLLKPNCFISGHDYHHSHQPVKDAVIELLGEPDITFSDTSWIKLIK